MAALCRVLSDPSRVKIFALLRMDLCVSALAQATDLSESAVSQHLRRLREAGLVQGEKRSYWTHYRARTGALRALSRQLSKLADELGEAPRRCQCSEGEAVCPGGENCPMTGE